ncbi:MAG: hypothetical protein ABIK89_04740 [Planctomycetota bacterium]
MICPKCGGNGSVLTARMLLNPTPGPPSPCSLCRGVGAVELTAFGVTTFQSAQIEQLTREVLEAKGVAHFVANLYAELTEAGGPADVLAAALAAVDDGGVTREEAEGAWPLRTRPRRTG